MVPGEFRRWVNAVEQRCRELQKARRAFFRWAPRSAFSVRKLNMFVFAPAS